MIAQKSWYLSKAIWGGIASILAGVGLLFGVEIDAEDLTNTFMQLSMPLSSLAGGILSVIGRGKATTTIKKLRE